ncbi:MAG: hypothetical protein H6551_11040 [Chitinophagales bacterium]|nr:hypothetical protein [Chitinophagaceae bacterium]MCB9065660.1 hypothetical protein [Chitinophagales bacterium]
MNKLLLYLMMLPSGLWKRLGADTEQLRAILHAKLLMDDRKPLSFGANKGLERKRKKKKERKNTSFITVLLSFFMGMIYVFPIIMVEANPVIGLAMFYSIFIVFFTFTLITDFANVLVDTKDKLILFPKPVSDKTIMLSRLLYIFIYIFRLAIPMSLPAWIVFGIIKGWVGVLWFPIPLVFLIFVAVFLVCGFYLLMLRLSKPGKFQDVLNYAQIGFSIVFFATYMLSSRMIDPEALQKLDIQVFSWAKYVPTYWVAASWTWIEPSVEVIEGTRWLSILAVVFPLFSLWATVKYLAPSFVKGLVSSDNVNTEKPTAKKSAKEIKSQNRVYRWANMFNKSDASKAGFIITWLQTNRSRNFRMRVYPTFAYVPVYFFYVILIDRKPFMEVWNNLPNTKNFIILLYMTTFVIMQGVTFITMSEHYKASWVYFSSPLQKPGEVIAGAFKAMWVKYFLPFMIAIGIFVVYVWGPSKIWDVILATINITLFIIAQMYFGNRMLPFSQKEQIKDKAGKTMIRMLLIIVLMGGLGLLHGLTLLMWWLKLIFIVLSAIMMWMFYDSLKNTPWEKLKTVED